jgi:hypothetical protein
MTTPGTWTSLDARASNDLAASRRSLDEIGAAISERSLALVGMTREDAAASRAQHLAGPPPTTYQLWEIAPVFGATVRDPASGAPEAA